MDNYEYFRHHQNITLAEEVEIENAWQEYEKMTSSSTTSLVDDEIDHLVDKRGTSRNNRVNDRIKAGKSVDQRDSVFLKKRENRE